MRVLAVVLGASLLTTAAVASTSLDVTVLPKPGFPAPATDVAPSGRHFVLRSSRPRSPAALPPPLPAPPAWAPRTFRDADLLFAIRQQRPSLVFFVYGSDGTTGRYLVRGDPRAKVLEYAIDFVNFTVPPAGSWIEGIAWAREVEGVLYVEHTHFTYASATRRRNAYVSAIDLGPEDSILGPRRTLWRSPALVANARTFVLDGDYIVSGYGFTAEPDYLYLLDRSTGRVRDRLELPSAPEIVKRRGNRLYVRTYDRAVVAQTIGP